MMASFVDITRHIRYEERLEALHRHATELSSAETMEEIAKLTFNAIELVLGFHGGDFSIIEGNRLVPVYVKGVDLGANGVLPLDGPGITVRAVVTGESQLVSDTRKDNDYIQVLIGKEKPSLSELVVPVKVEDEVVATINLENVVVNAFTEEDQRLIELFAEHVASAISKIRNLERLRESLQTSADIVSEIPSGLFIYQYEPPDRLILLDGNQEAESLTGLKVEEWRGKEFNEIWQPENKVDLKETYLKVRETGETFKTEDIYWKDERLEGYFRIHSFNIPGDRLVVAFENTTERKRYEETLVALHHNAKKLSQSQNREEVYQITLDAMEQTLGFDRVDILMVEDDVLKQVAANEKLPRGLELPLNGKGITVKAVNEKRTILVNDVRKSQDYIYMSEPTTGEPLPEFPLSLSELTAPIIIGGKAIGVLNVESTNLNAFTKQDETLLEMLTIHVASAIRRLWEHAEEQRYEERLEALHNSAVKLAKAGNMGEVYATTFDAIDKALGFKAIDVIKVEDGILRDVITKGPKRDPLELPLTGPGITVRAARTGETQLVGDVRNDPDYFKGKIGGSLSELAVPVLYDGKAVAVLNVESSLPDVFTEQDRELFETLAMHVASAIKHLRQVDALSKQEDRLTALHKGALRLAEAETMEEIAEAAVDSMRHSLGFEVASYLNVEDMHLVTAALEGAEMRGLRFPLDGKGITVKTARTGRTILIHDTRKEPDYVEGSILALSELAVPVKVNDEVMAVLNVESTRVNAYDDNDRMLLEILAMYVASAIEILREKEKLQRSLGELERSNRELDDYTHVVSHDLKAPLRSITAFSEFLQEDYLDKLDETGREYLNRIKTASKQMDRFIQDLLVLSRVGRKYKETEMVDLNKLMDEITLDFEAQLKAKGAEIIVGQLPTITTQKVWIRQLFANLIGNGLKFNVSPAPRIEVSYEERQTDYLFSVKDNGIGIKEEDQSRLFKLFQRLHTHDEYPGTGTGLAICRKIVESFGGKIWVESKPDVGSTFNFTYPKETFTRVKGPRPQDLSLQPIEAIKAIQTEAD